MMLIWLAHISFMKTRMVQVNPMVHALLSAHVHGTHQSMKARAQVFSRCKTKQTRFSRTYKKQIQKCI